MNDKMSSYRPRSIFFPLLLIAVGLFVLLSNLRLVDGGTWITIVNLWPVLFIAGGLDGLYRREGYTGAILGIGIGTIFLMANFGYLVVSGWQLAARLWPILIISAGLDLVVGRRSGWSALAGVLLGLGLVAVIVWLGVILPTQNLTVTQSPIGQKLSEVKTARVELEPVVGRLKLSAGAASGFLVDGQAAPLAGQSLREEFNISGSEGKYVLGLRGAGISFNPFGNYGQAGWDLRLAGKTPMELNTKMVVGEQDINLTDVEAGELQITTVIGQTRLTLPAVETNGDIQSVIGELVLRFPREAGVRLNAGTVLTSVSLPSGWIKNGREITSPNYNSAAYKITLDIQQVIGALVVQSLP